MMRIAWGHKLGRTTLPALLWLAGGVMAHAQAAPPGQTPASAPAPTVPKGQSQSGTTTPGAAGSAGQSHGVTQQAPPVPGVNAAPAAEQPVEGVLVDQVLAVVNGDLVLESDVNEEHRLEAFQPIRSGISDNSREAILQRLIDRTLILEEAKLQPDDAVTDAEATADLTALRKEIPACREYHCETEAGWERFVQAQGFTLAELTELWRQRMEVLRFIEQRFRSGIRITPAQIKDYYEKTLLPEYAKQHAKAPPLDVLSDRIQQILLQQQVSALLVDWLQSLKAQGTVRIMKAGEVRP